MKVDCRNHMAMASMKGLYTVLAGKETSHLLSRAERFAWILLFR